MSKFNKKVKQASDKSMTKRMALAVPDKYAQIDFIPPQSVADAAKRALEVRASKPASQRGMTAVGIARARDLSNRKPLSPETIRRMVAYFTRHEVDKQGSTWGEQGRGWQSWYGWGGDAGFAWAKKVLRQMEKADEKEVNLSEPASIPNILFTFNEKAISMDSEVQVEKDSLTGLWLGKPFKTLSIGTVYSRMTGKDIARPITKQDLQGLVEVFNRTKDRSPVIIDWNHYTALENAPMESQISLGKIDKLELSTEGDAILAYPLYTDKGLEMVKANQGVLWSSPEFILGEVYDRADGSLLSPHGQILAITLTNRPAQSHNLIEPIALKEELKLMEYTIEQLQAMPVEELAKLCMEKHQLVLELEKKVKDLQAEIDALTAEEVTEPSEPMDAPQHATMSEHMVLLNEIKAQNIALSERVKSLESEKHNLEKETALNGLLSAGKITPAEKSVASKAFDIKGQDDAFWRMFSERASNSAVNLSVLSHSSKPAKVDVVEEVKNLAKAQNLSFNEALDIYKKNNKDAYLAYVNGDK